MTISDETLDKLMRLSDACPTNTWTSSWEGRDHQLGGSSFILTEGPGGRGDDVYVSEESASSSVEVQDLIAAARTYLPLLIEEIRSYREK